MEAKDEHADSREVRESYTILMETEAIIRTQRTLRREICISRIVVFILLFTCTAFCVILYLQHGQQSKNNNKWNKGKANEMSVAFQTDNQSTDDEVQTHLASLSFRSHPVSGEANLTWEPYNIRMNDFFLEDNGESLVIPQEGKYKIGLQITYGEEKPRPEKGQIDLAHTIIKYSDAYQGKPETILSVYETIFKQSTWFKSVYSEVIHVFNEGDKIKVESKNATLIDSAGEWSTKNFLTIQFLSSI